MSKYATIEQANRGLASIDKGADFLSRVDVVVQVPGFDTAESQLDLALVAVARRAAQVTISELALWMLGSVKTSHNFRTITKMLKTVGDGEILVSDLNVDATQTDRLWAALGEYGAFTAEDLVSLASPDYERANTMATIAFDGSPGRDATVRPERA